MNNTKQQKLASVRALCAEDWSQEEVKNYLALYPVCAGYLQPLFVDKLLSCGVSKEEVLGAVKVCRPLSKATYTRVEKHLAKV